MEAIYFGNAHWAGNTGAGTTGPWAGADLEQGTLTLVLDNELTMNLTLTSGMYYGGGNQTKVNNQSQPLPHDFVSLMLKGRTDGFALKACPHSPPIDLTLSHEGWRRHKRRDNHHVRRASPVCHDCRHMRRPASEAFTPEM
jgi:hypothetical protein